MDFSPPSDPLSRHAVRFEIEPAPEQRAEALLETHSPRPTTLKARNIPARGPHAGTVVTGVQLDVYLDATGLDDALEGAWTTAEDYITEMFVLSASRCGILEPQIAVDIDPSASVHPIRQFVRLRGEVSRRFLTASQVPAFRRDLSSLSEDMKKSVRRAIHAYREAMSANDPLVEFLTLWVGVEALNKTLGQARGMTTVRRLEGTERFFETHIPDGALLYKRAYELRNDFAHGSRDIEQMAERAEHLVGPMRLACRDAIASAVGERWEGDRRPLKNRPVFFVFETTLQAPPGAPLGPEGDLPHFHFGDLSVLDLRRTGDKVDFQSLVPVLEERFAPGVERGPVVHAWLSGEQVELSGVKFEPKDG